MWLRKRCIKSPFKKDFYYLHTNWYETKTKYVEVRVKTTKNYFWDREQQSSACGQKLEIEARFFLFITSNKFSSDSNQCINVISCLICLIRSIWLKNVRRMKCKCLESIQFMDVIYYVKLSPKFGVLVNSSFLECLTIQSRDVGTDGQGSPYPSDFWKNISNSVPSKDLVSLKARKIQK